MTEDPRVRLFRQILSRAGDHFILSRMKRFGFWPQTQPLPPDPPDELEERRQIEREMKALEAAHQAVANPEEALAEERKRRWEESKRRRAAAKAERERLAQERREAYAVRRQQTIVHAGEGVSGALLETDADLAKLQRFGLPIVVDSADLAKQLWIPLATLRWLTYHRRGATLVHYHRYSIPKKAGGRRGISAPKAALRRAQQWVLDQILSQLPLSPQTHGFAPRRSIVTNAAPHAGRAVVINLDLQDFFPTLTFPRVKGLFRGLGYSGHVATCLALLCTEPPRVEAEVGGKLYYVALGDRMLPQGACTSPAITNLVCRRLDRRLDGLARRHRFQYTRYADDLTFSGDDPAEIGSLIRRAKWIVRQEGFEPHPKKTRVMRRGRRQEVTGVVVNQRPTVSRREVRNLRALLHNAKRSGLQSQNRDGRPNFAAHLAGRVAFVCMVDPRKGAPLRAALRELTAD